MTEYIYSILKKYYGYDEFREGQEDLIQNIIKGNDTLGIMPTGAGKSICYQIPAIALSGITIVISPLISLMKDQVATLNQNGIRAAYLNSSLTYPQFLKALSNAKKGIYKIIYVAPERLTSQVFLDFALNANISLIAVDEAHCISQWGQDFRPSYTKIIDFVNLLNPKPSLCAFTATATPKVRDDIIEKLKLNNPFTVVTSFDRENLYFSVESPCDKNEFIYNYISDNLDKCGIIYCSTRKQVELLSTYLLEKGIDNCIYHAGMEDNERNINQENFIFDRCKIIIATSAFGMGIDKSDVRYVIHFALPLNLEEYYQQAGRAGRDGEKANCILLYAKYDVRLNHFLIEKGVERLDLTDEEKSEYTNNESEKLKLMTFYATGEQCLRKSILNYFGENYNGKCDNCSNCNKKFEAEELTLAAKYILKTIYNFDGKYGYSMIIDYLQGNENIRFTQKGYDVQDNFGILCGSSWNELRKTIYWLVENEYVYENPKKNNALKLMYKGSIFVNKNKIQKIIKKNKVDEKIFDADIKLFNLLKERRKDIAKSQGVPAYVIATDKTLNEMATYKPKTQDGLYAINGLGQVKIEKYGEKFIETIKKYDE